MSVSKEETYGYAPILNRLPEVQAPMAFPEKVEICDLTLDENGEGMAGAYMTDEQKITLAQMLDDMGVQRLGVLGYPSPISKEEVEATRKITKMGLKAKCQSLASTKEDVDSALEAEVWGVTIRTPCSDLYTPTVTPIEEKIKNFIELGSYARSHGLYIGMMAQDVSRADPAETEVLLRSIQDQFGLDELCVTDSQGLGNPFSIHYLIKKIKTWMDVPVAVHCHNMLGMGVANACAAAAAGAQIIHTTVNGVGHFSGMPPTEEVAIALKIGYGVDVGIQFERLYELSRTVQEFTRVRVQQHKPVVGELMFSRSEEAKHIQELIDCRELGLRKGFFPYLPEFVGHKARVVMAQKVTRLAVEFNLSELGLSADDAQIDEIHKRVKDLATMETRIVANRELESIANEVIS